MIVDDDVRNIFALTGLLEKYSMQVIYAENGREGIEVLQQNPDVNIVLMDVMMPEMDGTATFQKLQANPLTEHIPVILLTAKGRNTDRDLFADLPVKGIISKPFNSRKLAAQVAAVLE